MGWEYSGVVGFDLGPLVQGQMRTAKLKSAYNSLIIGPRGFGGLSLGWIQFSSVLRCARSSLNMLFIYFWFSYNIVKLEMCSSWHSFVIVILRFSLLSKSVVT